MNQKQLEYFLKVYEKKSIAKAAEELFISPQGLSKMISNLEKELDVTLFIHKANRIIPTSASAALASHARAILSEFDLISNRLFSYKATEKKALPIYCIYDVPQLFDVEFINDFNTNFPDRMLKLWEMPTETILKELDANNIEMGIIDGPLNGSKYSLDLLFEARHCIIVNKKNPIAKRKFVTVNDLRYEPEIIKDLGSPSSLIQYNEQIEEGFIPNIIIQTSDIDLIIKMAEANQGIGFSLDYLVKKCNLIIL